MIEPSEGKMAAQTAISRSNLKEKSQLVEEPQRIATTFGNLTRAEIRDWERMLGQKLLRIANELSNQAQPLQELSGKPRHQR